jgi:dTDP-glucose 4,6-dehydratase
LRRVLVTGGAGFIGSNFVHYWRRVHPQDRVVVLDALTYAGSRENLSPLVEDSSYRFVHGDINDSALVLDLLRSEKIDTLVHFAAETHVDRSIEGPDAFIQSNVVGTHSLLKAARRAWLEEGAVPTHRFHQVSTDEVFGSLGIQDAPFRESSPYSPSSPYSASKAASDHLVNAYRKTYGLQATTSCSSNNYGPRQYPEKLIPLCILNLLRGLPLPIYGDGRQVREWLHVDDHCRGVELVIERGRPGEVYNLGGGSEVANIDLVTKLCGVVDDEFHREVSLARRFPAAPAARGVPSQSLVTFVADRPGHDLRYALDGRKARGEVGFEPRIDLAAGLRETVAWYLGNEAWWGALRSSEKARL